MQSLPLASLLLDALPRPSPEEKRNRLRIVSELTAADILIVAHECAYGLERMLMESVNSLKESFTAMDKKTKTLEDFKKNAASKFTIIKEMECGTIKHFHEGLEGRIGNSRVTSFFFNDLLRFDQELVLMSAFSSSRLLKWSAAQVPHTWIFLMR